MSQLSKGKQKRPTARSPLQRVTVERLMTKDVDTCTPEDSVARAAQIMWERDCGCVPVIASDGDRRVVGMITDRDICMAAYTKGRALDAVRVEEAMARGLIACGAADAPSVAEARMAEAQVRRLLIIDEEGKLLGLVSLCDIAREAERERTGKRRQVKDDEIGRTLSAMCRARSAGPGTA
jgi:CBS domain-containing protein